METAFYSGIRSRHFFSFHYAGFRLTNIYIYICFCTLKSIKERARSFTYGRDSDGRGQKMWMANGVKKGSGYNHHHHKKGQE